ncbi:thioesterase family protein [Lentisphaerota bacterium ZTH]|nr:acyl-CoA thioesterase [Lentisphaerota bacterium]WET06017.1 thioesterase family protein [Lentisphaerota bacterium ZTH]
MTYRVPYADTDQMGVVYYANYLVYFERSRTEMLRDAGLPYSEIERRGYLLPVVEANLKYKASAHYDELLTFRSIVKEARGIRLVIASEVFRDGKLLVSGEVTMACADKNHKLTRIPAFMLETLNKY